MLQRIFKANIMDQYVMASELMHFDRCYSGADLRAWIVRAIRRDVICYILSLLSPLPGLYDSLA